jgi:hypothetical protein
VVVAGLAAPAALGIGAQGSSLRLLQSHAQLAQTPDAAVPAPAVPEVPVQVPSAPEVPAAPQVPTAPQAPAAPQVETPSAPSVEAPAAPVPGTPSTPSSAPSSSVPGSAPATGRESSAPGTAPATRAKTAVSPEERAQRRERQRAQDTRVRSEVRELRGCLAAIGEQERDYLSLRAGIDGPPRSRREASRETGVSRGQGRRLELRGLRALRVACGGTVIVRGYADGSTAALMPAVLLAETGDARPLVPAERLARGDQQVAGAEATSDPIEDGEQWSGDGGTQPAQVSSRALATTSSGAAGMWIGLAAALVMLGLMALLVARRHTPRAAGAASQGRATATAAPSIAPVPVAVPAPEPEELPEADPEPGPTTPMAAAPAPATHTSRRDYRRAARPAAIAASGLLSFIARELLRRRRR